ncbi:MAG: hypothetical protein HQL71_14370 [Magnetococcales bacterium]|nr:hypothetical protein [Magnetococcales bacterium]
MSFILEALKKSENENAVGKIPDKDLLSDSPFQDDQSESRFSLPKIAGGLLLFGGVAGLFMLVFSDNNETDTPLTNPTKSVAQPAITSQPPADIQTALIPIENKTVDPIPDRRTPPTRKNISNSNSINTNPTRTVTKEPVKSDYYQPQPNNYAIVTKAHSDGPRFSAKVVGITSGCLIEVKQGDHFQKIKLANISCTKPSSITGKKARRYATKAMFIQTVIVAFGEETSKNHLIADVHLSDGTLINRQLVQLGLVQASDLRFKREEEQAKVERRGMWRNIGRF